MMARMPWPRGGVRTKLPVMFRRNAEFSPADISGLALWLDGSDTASLYTTDAGAVTAVSSPLDISGCALWLDASDASTISDTAGAVDQWDDKSGNARHFTGTTTARPTTGTRTKNGLNVLDFNGAQSLVGNAAALSIARNVSGLTAFVVAKHDSVAASRQILFQAETNGDFARFVIDGGAGITPGIAMRLGGRRLDTDAFDSANAAAFSQNTNDTVFAGTIAYSAATAVLHANGSAIATDGTFQTAGNTSDTDSYSVTVGSGYSLQNTIDGYIAEIIVYDTALTTAQRASVEAYLAAKWGISGVHAPATTAGDPVGYWADKSGNNRHATQATAASRPTVSAIGNRRALRLGASGAVSRLSLGNLSAAFPSAGNVFVAFQPNNDSQYTLYSTRNNDDTYANTSTSLWGTWVNTRTSVASSRPSSGVHVANLYGTSGLFSVIEDGALIHSSSVLTYEAGNDHNIGSRPLSAAGQTPLDGWIAEVIAYNRALTSSERRKIEQYLANRWGITLAPQVSNADAQDWINRVYANGGTVSTATASAVNTFCEAIASAGIRDRFYRLNLFCGSATASLTNCGCLVPLYRGPAYGGATYGGATDVMNATLDYSESTGLFASFNAPTKWLNTGLQTNNLPSAVYQALHLSVKHGGITVVSGGTARMIGSDNGVTDRANLHVQLSTGAAIADTSAMGKTATVTSATPLTGNLSPAFLLSSRTGPTSLKYYRNGVPDGSQTANITGIGGVPYPIYVFVSNNTGSPLSDYPARYIQSYSVGAGLTDPEVAAFHSALSTFNTTLGRP